jgi:SNF2 family DNA or RNA helicase
MPNGLQDLFGQMYVVDLGVSLGSTITSFRSRFLERMPTQTNFAMYKARPGAYEEVSRRIKRTTIYLDKQDYLKMPALKINPIYIDLPPKWRKMYDQLENDFYLEIGDKGIEAFNSGALAMKLRQFLQGFVYHFDEQSRERRIVEIHQEKLDMLKELSDSKHERLEGFGNAIIVYFFQHDREILRRVFKSAPAIDSRTPEAQASIIFDQWNAGKVPILLANSASLNYGLNLQDGGNNIIWYAQTWNAEHWIQLRDRLWRQRQIKPVFVHSTIFRDTVEERIFKAIMQKNAKQKDVLKALKRNI